MSYELQTAVLGATGYSGFELTRILSRHPRLKTPLLLRREGSEGGAAALDDLYPQLAGQGPFPPPPFYWGLNGILSVVGSIATMVLTTDTLVVEKKEPAEPAAAGGHGHGHGHGH